MSLSFRNIVNGNQISDVIGSDNLSKDTLMKSLKKKESSSAKYIKGYATESSIEALANSLNINKGLFKQAFGLEEKTIDAYDPYHTSDAKKEEFWDFSGSTDGKAIQKQYDEDTYTFKRSLYSEYGFRQNDFWYEDPFIPSFELFFKDDSPFFMGDDNISEIVPPNCLKYFIQKYGGPNGIDQSGYDSRFVLWSEFKKIFFKIFEKDLKDNSNRNIKNKAYYITKIAGLNNLNKKIINYGEDKITITLNEDVSMIAWYISELYNNIIYSYKNQRYMFPENLIRFDLTIKINDIRNYQLPQGNNGSSDNIPNNSNILGNNIKNVISPKSQIVYTLHDCTFNFFESKNYDDEIEIGGYGKSSDTTPKTLSFDIFYKSTTRYSKFPLIDNGLAIDAWENPLYTKNNNIAGNGTKQSYYDDLDRIKASTTPTVKSYLNNLLAKSAQNVVNQGLNYMDNLESKLRDVRGSAVNSLLSQFRNVTTINKIEPDNVYNSNFNNNISLGNFGKTIASGLLNDLENNIRSTINF